MRTPLRGDKTFFRGVAAIGLPVALQNLLTTSASMVDTMMIGSQGETAVAAVGLCAQFSMLMMTAYYGFANGGTLFYAQCWGAKDEKGICRAYGLALTCSMFFALLFGAAAVLAPEFILRIYTDKVVIQQAGLDYLRIIGFSFPFQVLAILMSSLLRSIEKVKVPLYASILSLVTNTFLNWVLIYGKFGFPALGVVGAAIGTLAANIVNVAVLYIYCFRDKGSYLLRVRDHFRWNLPFVRQYFSKSMVIVANEASMGVSQMLLNIIIGRQDESAIAALAVFRVLEGLVFAFFKGMTNAAAVIVGKQVGAGEHVGGYTDGKRFALYCPAITLGICLVMLPFRRQLLGIFGLGEQALLYGMQMLLFYTLAATLRTCNWICNDCYRAGGDPVFGTVLETIVVYCITIPATALAGMAFHAPFIVVFMCMYADDFVRLPIVLRHMASGKWLKPVTPEGRAALPAFHEEMRRHGHTFRNAAARQGHPGI